MPRKRAETGVGFVNFATPLSARKAICEMHDKVIDDVVITVNRAVRKKYIYSGSMSPECESGLFRYVNFERYKSAEKAAAKMDGNKRYGKILQEKLAVRHNRRLLLTPKSPTNGHGRRHYRNPPPDERYCCFSVEIRIRRQVTRNEAKTEVANPNTGVMRTETNTYTAVSATAIKGVDSAMASIVARNDLDLSTRLDGTSCSDSNASRMTPPAIFRC